MATCDLYNNIKTLQVLDIDTYTTGSVDGNVIDMSGFESVVFLIATGSGTDGDFSFSLAEADLDPATGMPGSFTAVDTDRLLTAFPKGAPNNGFPTLDGSDSDDYDLLMEVGYVGNKRFLKLTMVAANAGTGMTIGAFAVLGHPHSAPITDE